MRLFMAGFLVLTGLLFSLPLACQKTYSVAPLTGSGTGGAPTSTPTCVSLSSNPPSPTGIVWGEAYVASGSNYGSPGDDIELYMTVNGAPVSNAGVTFSGTGVSPTALVYGGPYTISGTSYGWYYYQSGTQLTAGGTYTLSSTASTGTASASLAMPNYPTLAPDGSAATWAGPTMSTYIAVLKNSSSPTYTADYCYSPPSPFSIPASAYPSSGPYVFGVERINVTNAITGGSGLFYVYNLVQEDLTK